ncbi:MAG: HAD-IB family hydrolase [Verrucomicrobiae bacterium]|nr:HAD-IB family hydrolase [Verrucomicrobiae bacterium]
MAGETEKPVVAVFDFDGTITYADSFLPYLRHISGFAGFWVRFLILSPALALHFAGLIGSTRAKELFLKCYLGGESEEKLRSSVQDFVKRRLRSLENPLAMARVEWHRGQGHRLILLSASPELYLNRWATENGFNKVLGTLLEMRDGRITGRIAGKNCHGPEKVFRLEEELGDLRAYTIYSYGDSRSDRVLLNRIDHAGYRSFEGPSRVGYALRSKLRFLRALL